MNPPETRIVTFIREHHILNLAVAGSHEPWCATCFYAYDESTNGFIFTSDDDTRHITDVVSSGHYRVAGTIALETRMVGKIRGIQFSGTLRRLEGQELTRAKKFYLKTFPIAGLAHLTLWGVNPDYIKMTDNRLGFGKKLIWEMAR